MINSDDEPIQSNPIQSGACKRPRRYSADSEGLSAHIRSFWF